VKYHPGQILALTPTREPGRRTVPGCQFCWGGG
jgi:hypothetical protein